VALPDPIQAQLKSLYASPSNDLPHINRMRAESDANCCPMCGSFHSGTLDHLLPRPIFRLSRSSAATSCRPANATASAARSSSDLIRASAFSIPIMTMS